MLYQAVRPQTLKDIVGNAATVASLESLVAREPADRPHTFLFKGPSGCGKTTLARALARAFGCDVENALDYQELNAANTRGIDTIREVTQTAAYTPMTGGARVIVLDESHQLTKQAQEALLKVTEDVPVHTYFMYCTTAPERLLPTLRNRAAVYEVRRMRPQDLTTVLDKACTAIGRSDISADVLDAIVLAANGCPRQGLMILEQVLTIEDPKGVLEFIQDSYFREVDQIELMRALVTNKPGRWNRIRTMLPRVPNDQAEPLRRAVLGYLSKVLLNSTDKEAGAAVAQMLYIFSRHTYDSGMPQLVAQFFEACTI